MPPLRDLVGLGLTLLSGPMQVSLPSATTAFVLVLVSYFFVISGIVFDVIQEPPGMGVVQVSKRSFEEGLNHCLVCVGSALTEPLIWTGPASALLSQLVSLCAFGAGVMPVASQIQKVDDVHCLEICLSSSLG